MAIGFWVAIWINFPFHQDFIFHGLFFPSWLVIYSCTKGCEFLTWSFLHIWFSWKTASRSCSHTLVGDPGHSGAVWKPQPPWQLLSSAWRVLGKSKGWRPFPWWKMAIVCNFFQSDFALQSSIFLFLWIPCRVVNGVSTCTCWNQPHASFLAVCSLPTLQ